MTASEMKSVRVIRMSRDQALGLVQGKPCLEDVLNDLAPDYVPISVFPVSVTVQGRSTVRLDLIVATLCLIASGTAEVSQDAQLPLPMIDATKPPEQSNG